MQRDITAFAEALPRYQVSTSLRPDGEHLLTLTTASGKAVYQRILQKDMTDAQLISRIKLDLLTEEPPEQRDISAVLQDSEAQNYTSGKIHRTRWERLWEERKVERSDEP